MATKTIDIKNLNFEEALAKLESIVSGFESQQIDLEQAIKNYALGEELRQHCEGKLTEAKLKVEQITTGQGGKLSTTDFDSN